MIYIYINLISNWLNSIIISIVVVVEILWIEPLTHLIVFTRASYYFTTFLSDVTCVKWINYGIKTHIRGHLNITLVYIILE